MADDRVLNWVAEHVKLYLEDPEKAHDWDSASAGGTGVFPTLLLVMTGRKSGQERMLPLIYKKIGNRYAIIASKGGQPAHPSWYLNVVATPTCRIQVGKKQLDVVARTASGEERQRIWDELVEVYPPYNPYQEKAGAREIPVVVLDPA